MAQGRTDNAGPLGRLVSLGRRWLEPEAARPEPVPDVERRASKRIPLRLPVDACLEGSKFQESRLVDVSLRGLALALGESGAPGQKVSIRFRSTPAGLPAFMLQGRVVRVLEAKPELAGINVGRGDNSPESLDAFRRLVLYYLRHKPLLEEMNSGYFEGRCPACNWVGHVGERGPRCAKCGGPVERI